MWWKTALSWTWRLLLLVPLVLWATAWLAIDGVAGETWGWFRVAGVLLPVTGLLALVLFQRRGPVVGAVVVGLALATLLWSTAPTMPSRLKQEVAGVEVPGRLVDEHDTGVDLFFGTPPSLTLVYEVDQPTDEVVRALAEAFAADGWTARPDHQWDQVYARRHGFTAHAYVEGRTIDLTVNEG